MNAAGVLLAGLFAGAGAAIGGYFIGEGFEAGREPVRKVTVKGLAERAVRADMAEWPLQLTASSGDLQAARAAIEEDLATLESFAVEMGLDAEAVIRQRLHVHDQQAQMYGPGNYQGDRYIINQTVLIRSGDVVLVEGLSRRTSELVERGVVLQDMQGPSFVFTGLTDIKPEMIAEATRDARAGAERFAADSGSEVGAILRASQGYFEIAPLVQANPYDQGQGQIDKKVRVVTTIDFLLED